MQLNFTDPEPAGSERAREAKATRDHATESARLRPHAVTESNGEESDLGPCFPASFTKGLEHDHRGLLADAEDYRTFVEAINSSDRTLFDTRVRGFHDKDGQFRRPTRTTCVKPEGEAVPWRGWESPRAGHAYELEGADPGAVGMAPAPRVGSSELAAEMAELYALALLRDVPFTTIGEGGDQQIGGDSAGTSSSELVALLNGMPFYSGQGVVSSTPGHHDDTGLNRYERNRRSARNHAAGGGGLFQPITPATAFRGSTPGAGRGPYLSQLMLIGGTSRACPAGDGSGFPGLEARFDLEDGFIRYGSTSIDQRTLSHRAGLDHMTDWCSWLDVQNGADVSGTDRFEDQRRFITTPRDLATYVHYDALYQAYLNAALLLVALGVPASRGFPEPSPSRRRDAFATFGDPHVLTLVTEVATRSLKAVRRQKFNHHRRARPEALGGRLSLLCHDRAGASDAFGRAAGPFVALLDELPADLRDAVSQRNDQQPDDAPPTCGMHDDCGQVIGPGCNLLLPMAFPEGSPMHPSYGAGHATVAGGCVTILKAFFEMFQDGDRFSERLLTTPDGVPISFVPDATGATLVASGDGEALTVQGELDKLAANIAIGRNMAGVHYYSDYYDSLRLGERVAVSILLEQASTYLDEMSMSLTSFDGDHLVIRGEAGRAPTLTVLSRTGEAVPVHDWWLRHVPGESPPEDR